MRYRKLRIAWSVVCGIVVALLVVLWVHSYGWHEDGIYLHGGRTTFDNPVLNGGTPLNAPLYGVSSQRGLMGMGYVADYAKTDAAMQAGSKYATKIYLLGLSLKRPPGGGWTLTAPHWFLILLSIAAGAAPWIRWSKRFNLRTLLLATTLVALLLGLAVYAATK